ncbi:plant cysteine oxidase 5 [Artemisia annua]|uniref:cysteine dioxygenase n=1 Tax=Artemisia annua TaxID=35608 RepID=A0A2U1NAS5_ARTAN|nr:plant cysteine oxidase 5 [Artemisia annua]
MEELPPPGVAANGGGKWSLKNSVVVVEGHIEDVPWNVRYVPKRKVNVGGRNFFVGLEQEAQLVRNWTPPTNELNGAIRSLPPSKYFHIHESESSTMGIFYMPPFSIIPLQYHLGMNVFSKLLYARIL